MYTTKFVGSIPIPLVVDVSWSFGNLQTNLKSSNWYEETKNKHFFMYNVATMVGSACSGSCDKSLT